MARGTRTPAEGPRCRAGLIAHADEPVSFETDIKPLFRELDQQSMRRAFDHWSHDDVSRHADAILARGYGP
ncbi:MAG: hypothetical protein QOE91_1137 [Gaiellaceae bacterium]|jgi:hypothetical protein|nr:hypothetical protein [Gaiellaceae bacterium]